MAKVVDAGFTVFQLLGCKGLPFSSIFRALQYLFSEVSATIPTE
jgi:hypothetical protein